MDLIRLKHFVAAGLPGADIVQVVYVRRNLVALQPPFDRLVQHFAGILVFATVITTSVIAVRLVFVGIQNY